MITLRDMQENKSPFGMKEIVELVDLNPNATDEQIKELVKINYSVEVEDMVITLAKVKF